MRIYDIIHVLFMTTTIRVIKQTTSPSSKSYFTTLYEGGTLDTEVPLNIQYMHVKGIEAAENDKMNIYVY